MPNRLSSTFGATVLCLESDRELMEVLDSLLIEAGFSTIRTNEARVALQTIWQHMPDLILLDVNNCGGDGMELCRLLRSDRRSRRTPMILLSEGCEEADRVLGLELGADDFVQIPFGRRELTARIRSLLRRSAPAPADVLKHRVIEVDISCRRVAVGGSTVPLTPTEFRILQFFAEFPERVHSREKIIEAVHRDGLDATERSIDPHVNTIRRKLGDAGSFIETVRGFGYRLK